MSESKNNYDGCFLHVIYLIVIFTSMSIFVEIKQNIIQIKEDVAAIKEEVIKKSIERTQ